MEYRKTVFLGAERVAEVRIGGDPGVAAGEFEAPQQVPRELSAPAVLRAPSAPDGTGRGGSGVVWLLAALVAVIRRLVATTGARRGLAATAAFAVVLSCGGSATNSGPDDDDVVFGGFVPEGAELVFLHSPRLGTPALRTDADGGVVSRSVSMPFGVHVRAADTSGGADVDAGADDFRFTDKQASGATAWPASECRSAV